jgi:phenylacetaldehyde dehydrogenase
MNAPAFPDTVHAAVNKFLERSHKLFIGGKWLPAQSGETFDVINPSTGKVFAKAASGAAADIDLAVKAARKAFESGPWPKMRSQERAALLDRFADLVEANADSIALLESMDVGNPVGVLRHVDVAGAVDMIREAAGWANKIMGDVPLYGADAPGFAYTMREPVGVAGLITPWNAPFFLAVNKIASALAAGCTCVLKPAELAPLSAIRIAELIEEAGFPAGVFNMVTGFGQTAGQALADHPDVNKISFTGSTRVGKSILAAAGVNIKRVTLELGGKSPVIVFADADLERATQGIATEMIFKTGQFCAAGMRLYVQKKVFDKAVSDIAARAKKVKVGPGFEPDTEMGPIISEKQIDRVMSYIGAGSSKGAELVAGGHRLAREGYFVEPTVLAHTRADMSVVQDEIFGPVLCAMPFGDADEIDRIAAVANDTSYGLAAKIWTRDLASAHRLARKIQAGTITINGGGGEGPLPFGGYKQSGLGREFGREGVLTYTEVKSVSIGF